VDLVVLVEAASAVVAVEESSDRIYFNHIVYNIEQQKVLQNGELLWQMTQ
jgi:hypothetical protein